MTRFPTPHPDAVGAALRGAAAVVDVRSPAEFAKGHVSGAVSLPLFSNDERAEIGTLYKLLGKERAIHKGLDLLGGKLTAFVEAFAPYQGAPLLVYCARGGMRSAAVVGLLSALCHRVTQLPGGYKAYRNHVLAAFEHALPPRLAVIHGQTGVGKTLLLQYLANSLDLEDCAQHRSSVFGAINLAPRTQQQFDADLLAALGRLDYARLAWVEGESRKIGSVTMPDPLRAAMQAAPCVLVTAPQEVRVARIVAEYGRPDDATKAQWEEALRQLALPLGRERVQAMIGRVWAGDYAPVVHDLLLDYYDPRYAHSMRGHRYALTVDSSDLDAAVAELEAFAHAEAGTGAAAAGAPDATARAARPAAG
jgi:tRNA 2-selenouridine synthase